MNSNKTLPLPRELLLGIVSYMLYLLALLASFAFADQTTFSRYGEARPVFWHKIYKDNANTSTLYCHKDFAFKRSLNIEHVFAVGWLKAAVPECEGINKKRCRRASKRFNLMESDLHNMYPAVSAVNYERSNYVFTQVDYGYLYDPLCPIEFGGITVEPPDYAKGKVARAVLYMTYEYQIDLDKVSNYPGFESEMLDWNCKYPPTPDEIIRHDQITKYQNTSNPFVLEKHCTH